MKLKRKIATALALAVSGIMCFAGCANQKAENKTAGYVQISQEEAKRLMDTESDYVIIDARTQEEYDAGHIEGAILIPEYEIADRAGEYYLYLGGANSSFGGWCKKLERSKAKLAEA